MFLPRSAATRKVTKFPQSRYFRDSVDLEEESRCDANIALSLPTDFLTDFTRARRLKYISESSYGRGGGTSGHSFHEIPSQTVAEGSSECSNKLEKDKKRSAIVLDALINHVLSAPGVID